MKRWETENYIFFSSFFVFSSREIAVVQFWRWSQLAACAYELLLLLPETKEFCARKLFRLDLVWVKFLFLIIFLRLLRFRLCRFYYFAHWSFCRIKAFERNICDVFTIIQSHQREILSWSAKYKFFGWFPLILYTNCGIKRERKTKSNENTRESERERAKLTNHWSQLIECKEKVDCE